jgi:hypothetical protein
MSSPALHGWPTFGSLKNLSIYFISHVLNFASEYPRREYLSESVYPKYSIESISIIFITDCILGMRNRQISERCDCYVDTILSAAKLLLIILPNFYLTNKKN